MKIEEFVLLPNFKELCEEKDIEIKYDEDLMLLKYGMEADFKDPIVKQSRGIIFNKNKEVVCKPFDKFCNYNEESADEIDWTTARVQEKLDGSLIKLYFYKGEWRFATNGTINAAKADVSISQTFQELIEKANNYNKIDFNNLKKDRTYLFELVSPKNQKVVEYPVTTLYHIGTRKLTGEEVEEDIGIQKPQIFEVTTLEDCVELANSFSDYNFEGFVVVDKNYNRIKVKTPAYIIAHRAINNGNPEKSILEFLIEENKSNIFSELSNTRLLYLELKYKFSFLEYEIEKEMQNARAYYEEYDFDRKATAAVIKNWKYPDAGFKALDSDMTAREYLEGVLERVGIKKIKKMI